jgi:hypothetical protein
MAIEPTISGSEHLGRYCPVIVTGVKQGDEEEEGNLGHI